MRPSVVLVVAIAAAVAALACTDPPPTRAVTLTSCEVVDGEPVDDGACTTCTAPLPEPTDEGDPDQPYEPHPDDDTPLTETQLEALTEVLGGGATARARTDRGPGPRVERGPIADAPGCNGFPDTVCTTHCCAAHDICYDKNKCTWKSWCGVEGAACNGCNARVVQCLARYGLFGCQLGPNPPCAQWKCGCNQRECYDATTKRHYCAAQC